MSQKSFMSVLAGTTALPDLPMICCRVYRGDSQLGRFWQNRGDDGLAREKRLLIDYPLLGCWRSAFIPAREYEDLAQRHENQLKAIGRYFCDTPAPRCGHYRFPSKNVMRWSLSS